jgi:hypothetical protein
VGFVLLVFVSFLQVYLLQNRSFGCFELLVSVLEQFLVVVGRLYFRPWVGFVIKSN